MKKLFLWITIFPLIINTGLTGCNQAGQEDVAVDLSAADIASSKFIGDPGSSGDGIEKKIIKRGSVSFQTDDMTKTRVWIGETAKKYKANISSENEYSYSGRVSQTISLRIPSGSFDSFFDDLERNAGSLDNKNISTDDVTEEYVDIEARLKNKKALEERYLELLKQARGVSEILEIEKQASDLRGEIESIEGRLKYLENQVSYSTLDITYYKETGRALNLGQKFKSGLANGWNNLMLFFVGLINLWPFVLIAIGLTWYLIKRKRRKTKS